MIKVTAINSSIVVLNQDIDVSEIVEIKYQKIKT